MKKGMMLMIACLCAIPSWAQTSDQPRAANGNEDSVKIATFKGPKPKPLLRPMGGFNSMDAFNGKDGWVYLHMMIDPKGKPYEISIVDSSGNEALEKAILRNFANSWRFEPATDGGTPIDSAFSMKFRVSSSKGARKEFISLYRQLAAALAANDRNTADSVMASMRAGNSYEDAYQNLARYYYSAKWGTEGEQLIALHQAITYENYAPYLPKDIFRSALLASLPLELRANDFSNALDTWKQLEKLIVDDAEKKKWSKVMAEIASFRTSNVPYSVPGEITRGTSWNFRLFRNKFQINISSGHISEVKLRCDKQYLFFPFDPNLMYTISTKAGTCNMELVGELGTKFTLVQA